MSERLRDLERACAADPGDLAALRALADERKRRGLEFLPDVVRRIPWQWARPNWYRLFEVHLREVEVRADWQPMPIGPWRPYTTIPIQ